MAITDPRPGLAYYPDAESYDEKIAELTAELGRKPTPADITHDLMVAVQMSSYGLPCRACGSKEAPIVGAFVPDPDRVELCGYTLCKPCGERWEKDPALVERVNADLMADLREQLGEALQ